MKLSRLVPLLAALAVIPACGNSPTAPLAEPGALLQSKGETAAAVKTIPTTTTTTVTTTSSDGESDATDPREGERRGGGYVGSGN